VGEFEGKRLPKNPGHMWRFNIIRGLQERSGMASLHLAQDREK
jgi:hypothetical protein